MTKKKATRKSAASKPPQHPSAAHVGGSSGRPEAGPLTPTSIELPKPSRALVERDHRIRRALGTFAESARRDGVAEEEIERIFFHLQHELQRQDNGAYGRVLVPRSDLPNIEQHLLRPDVQRILGALKAASEYLRKTPLDLQTPDVHDAVDALEGLQAAHALNDAGARDQFARTGRALLGRMRAVGASDRKSEVAKAFIAAVAEWLHAMPRGPHSLSEVARARLVADASAVWLGEIGVPHSFVGPFSRADVGEDSVRVRITDAIRSLAEKHRDADRLELVAVDSWARRTCADYAERILEAWGARDAHSLLKNAL
ncbi:MAG TPA: hypothetical protein VFX59_04635 [Polyangiales bacterium]|nr:hypothetical protein [Polyangiales bacterium]